MAMDSKARESVLVVVEGEAACPSWMDHWGDAPEDGWDMLEREEWEPAEMFSERLHTTLVRASADTDASATVVLVAAGSTEPAAMSARWRLAADLMNHLASMGGGRILLTRGYGHDGRAEPALEALAEDLRDEWSGAKIQVIVCLNEEPPASQIRISPPATTVRQVRRVEMTAFAL
jgi:hypothetical protein